MNEAAGRQMVLPVPSSPSLLSLISSGEFVPTVLSRDGWVNLAPGYGYSSYCNRQGLNNDNSGSDVYYQPGAVRIGIWFSYNQECASVHHGEGVGYRAGGFSPSSPTLSVYVRGPAAPSTLSLQSVSASPSATLSPGASPSVTATAPETPPSTSTASLTLTPRPTRSSNPTNTATSTGTLTRLASASTTATPSGTPFCASDAYAYHAGFDVSGAAALGSATVGVERDCARACCDVPGCDAYAFAVSQPVMNCFLVGNVTLIIPNHVLNSGIRMRVL